MTDRTTPAAADLLVVDDTPANLRLLEETLTERGYRVRTVNSGRRAIESAQADPPDLVLLDVRMPEMDGLEVCRQFKQDPGMRDIPVIFLSALGDVEDKVAGFNAGGVDYITKPFQVEEVQARVETHLSLRRLQIQVEAANRRLQRELYLAGRVQASLLPDTMPGIPGWEFAAALRPARETSGDFYDILRLSDGNLGLVIADVVDKGAPAAMLMAMSWGLLWGAADRHPQSPQAVVVDVNRNLAVHLAGGQFLTTFYGVLDTRGGVLRYVNGGHPPPLWLARNLDRCQRLALTGPLVGIFEDGEWPSAEAVLGVGDVLLLYTDGVTDAQQLDGAIFGVERLQAALISRRDQSAEGILHGILEDIAAFVEDAAQFDDIALLIARRTG